MAKIFLKVYGCKVNQYELQVMQERLLEKGHEIAQNPDQADYVLVNTCTVTHESDRTLEHFIRKTKRENQKTKIILAGCYSANHWEKLQEDGRIAGLIRDRDKHLVPEWIAQFEDTGKKDFSPVLSEEEKNEYYGITDFAGRTRAFVKVQDGCNKHCSFCIVTIVRGESRSRPPEEICTEIEKLADAGYREVVLTGVQVGAYGRDFKEKGALAALIDSISAIAGIERIRLSSIDPLYVDETILDCMKRNPKFCNHLHISLQSGDDEILKKMLRGHDAARFEKIIQMFQDSISGFAWSTDMICGFPGETEEAFQRSCGLLRRLVPMKVHVFPYSDREGTAASLLEPKIELSVKRQRAKEMVQIQDICFQEFAGRFVGRIEVVLVESRKEQRDGTFLVSGKLSNYLTVSFRTKDCPEKGLYPVDIKEFANETLFGEMLCDDFVKKY